MTTLIATVASLASATVSGLVFGINDTALLFGVGVLATAIFLATWEVAESLRIARNNWRRSMPKKTSCAYTP